MKGKFWVVLLLALVGGVIFVWLIKAPLVATYLTGKMKVPVTIRGLTLSPSRMMIEGFQINNPRGFHSTAAFKADDIEVDYQFSSLFRNPSVVDLIDVRNIFLSIELLNLSGSQNNWTAIASKIPKEDETPHDRELLIHKLVLTNMTVEIRGLGLSGQTQVKRIDRLEFNEIDSRRGFPTKELIQAIFQGAGLQDYIKEMLSPQNLLRQFQRFAPLGENDAVYQK